MAEKKTRRSDEDERNRLIKNLSYANRVIELFLPPETSDVLAIMEVVVKRGLSEAFNELEDGITIEQYAQYLSNLTYDALHSTRIQDEQSF